MPTTLAQIMGRFNEVTQDDPPKRWPIPVRVDWVNEAYKQIVVILADATATSAVRPLAPGVRQRLTDPASINLPNAYRMMDCVANATGQAVRRIPAAVMDGLVPDWRRSPSSLRIEHWMFDDRNPLEFLVFPPAAAGAECLILYSAMPEAHAIPDAPALPDLTETLRIPDIYTPAVLDYLLYRAYLKDADDQSNFTRATTFYQGFTQGLTGKVQADQINSPSAAPP